MRFRAIPVGVAALILTASASRARRSNVTRACDARRRGRVCACACARVRARVCVRVHVRTPPLKKMTPPKKLEEAQISTQRKINSGEGKGSG